MSNKESVITKRLKKYDKQSKVTAQRNDRQDRLKQLVEDHGVEMTALAGGFSVGTLEQYVRVVIAPSISEGSVIQAESILKGL